MRKTTKTVFKHSDMADLENKLKEHADKEVRWVVTDGVFSMEGDVANLPGLVDLCKQYDAKLIVDDSHGTGVLGKTGHGTHEHFNLNGQIDIFTSTLGKALGAGAQSAMNAPKGKRLKAAMQTDVGKHLMQGAAVGGIGALAGGMGGGEGFAPRPERLSYTRPWMRLWRI